LLTTSPDDGDTWSPPQVIIDVPGSTRAYDPSLWHDPAGRLWLFYNLADLVTHDYSVWAIITEQSTHPHPQWSSPRKIEVGVPFAFRLNKPTVLSTGEWLLPVTWAPAAPADWFPKQRQLQGVALSLDCGQTWKLHGGVEAPEWALENMLVEHRDGRVWMLIRSGGGFIWESFSTDRGRTWSDGSPTTLINPVVRFFIRRLASGRLLLINTFDPKCRKGMRACLSDLQDDSRFSAGLELDPRDKVSYPDAVQGPDGRIYAVHDCDRNGAGEILLDVFSEDEIQAGGR
jgi:predicted neuraminidase